MKCSEYYGPEDIQELRGAPDKMATIIGGIDTLGYLIDYPDLHQVERVDGKVLLRFVVTENGHIECMQYYSDLSMPYIESTVKAVERLEFQPAEKRGRKMDWEYVLPVFFKN